MLEEEGAKFKSGFRLSHRISAPTSNAFLLKLYFFVESKAYDTNFTIGDINSLVWISLD